MEVRGLPETLKVDLQCHQDGDLKRHDRSRIAAALGDKQSHPLCKGLSELQTGQKLSVRTCPVGASKPLSLLQPPAQGIAISVLPAKAPVSMVTAHVNGQKAAGSEPQQTSPINLQTTSRGAAAAATAAAAAAVQAFGARRAGELPVAQMLGTLSAVPIKVPQVSSLHRLAGQAATVLPQVRPKTQIPDSLPPPPCQEPQPVLLQQAAALLGPAQGATLPTANSAAARQPNSQSAASSPPPAPLPLPSSGDADSAGAAQHAAAAAGPGVAYAIIAAGNGVCAVSEAVKVIIIQPHTPSSTGASPEHAPPQEAPPTHTSPSQKRDEDPEKVAFMVALGLVTPQQLEEIQSRRQERKRRSTANPAYSGLFEPERKRLHYLNTSFYLSARDSEDFCWKDVEHEEVCGVCDEEEGELQLCSNCPGAFHASCLQPPLPAPPSGPWYCPKCQKKVLNKENMSWPQNFVQSYVTHKSVRQEEKRRLLRRNGELKTECAHLEEEDKNLNTTLRRVMEVRDRLLGQQRDTQASLERLKALIRLIQREQLIQVTMTTIAASLLSPSWIKASAAGAVGPGPSATPPHKSHGQEHAHN